jgi:hypothetical protein
MTWAIHVIIAPTWFDPADTLALITPCSKDKAALDHQLTPQGPPGRYVRATP